MDEQIRQIAERLRGLRDVLELTADDIARDCDISAEEYRLAETGEFDISVSMLQKIARHYGISLDALMFGQEPKMSSYFLTRAGKGTSIERTKAYKYQSLAAGFINRTADPFIVTVEPKPDSEPIHYNSHTGQEFNLVLEGRMMVSIDGKDLILNEGDLSKIQNSACMWLRQRLVCAVLRQVLRLYQPAWEPPLPTCRRRRQVSKRHV